MSETTTPIPESTDATVEALRKERAELIAANEAATGWGGALSARNARIKAIDAALAPTPKAATCAPEGWVWVPREPSIQILAELSGHHYTTLERSPAFKEVWLNRYAAALRLAAAPPAPQPGAGGEDHSDNRKEVMPYGGCDDAVQAEAAPAAGVHVTSPREEVRASGGDHPQPASPELGARERTAQVVWEATLPFQGELARTGGVTFMGLRNAITDALIRAGRLVVPTPSPDPEPRPADVQGLREALPKRLEADLLSLEGYLEDEGHTHNAESIREILALVKTTQPATPSHPAHRGAEEALRGIYVASKTSHAPRWRGLRADGFPVISTWIDEAGKGETGDWPDLWRRCVGEAATASAVVLYREEGETLKGALVEAGAALACGKPVFAVGCADQSFINHALVTTCATLGDALRAALAALSPATADQTEGRS